MTENDLDAAITKLGEATHEARSMDQDTHQLFLQGVSGLKLEAIGDIVSSEEISNQAPRDAKADLEQDFQRTNFPLPSSPVPYP